MVKATYRYGDRNADVDIRLTKSDDEWRIEDGALAIDVNNIRIPQPTLFGVDIEADTKVYVFPGPLVWGSKNPNISIEDRSGQEFPLGPSSYASANLQATLSPKGKTAVDNAVNTYLTNCATSTQARASTDKPGCSQSIYQSAVPGSVRWTKPTDLSKLSYRLDFSEPDKVSIYGSVQWSATFIPTSGSSTSGTDLDFLTGDVDLDASTPVFTTD